MTSASDLAHPFSTGSAALSRRRMLQVTAIGGAGAGLALAGCNRPETSPTPAHSRSSAVDMPTYRPLDVVSPDLISDDPEVPVAFLNYPANPPAVTEGTPPVAGAEPITAMAESVGPIPPSAPGNSYWAELNARLGADIDLSITPSAEYLAKLQTVVAGDQLPELAQIKLNIPQLGDLMDAAFLDLGPVVSGDAILKYPYLAAIPTYAWQACVVGGKLRGVPFSQPRLSNGFTARLDIVEELGLDMALRDGDDFVSWCRELTDPTANRWALQRSYGIEGEHYALDGSDPIATNADDVRVPTSYLGRCAPFIYFPGAPEMTEDQFNYHAEVKPVSEPLPTVGLTSEIELSKGSTIAREINDAISETLQGRRTMAQWPDAVQRWKQNGGDEIAQEYAEARQQQGG